MTVRIQSISGSRVTLELTVDLEDTMLASEEAILAGANEVGRSLSEVALKAFPITTHAKPILRSFSGMGGVLKAT